MKMYQRTKVDRLIFDAGYNVSEMAEAAGIHRNSLRNWANDPLQLRLGILVCVLRAAGRSDAEIADTRLGDILSPAEISANGE